MKKIIIVIILFISTDVLAQNDQNDLFSKGLEAYNNEQYEIAQNYFLQAFNNKKDKDALFNLAATTLMLKDTCGACEGFRLAANYFNDTTSERIYKEICVNQIVSVRYDKKYNVIEDEKRYKYFEELISGKCDTIQIGYIHKKGHSSTEIITADIFGFRQTDIIAAYTKSGIYKLYYFIYDASYKEKNHFVFKDYENKLKKYLEIKYDLSGNYYKNSYLLVDMVINESGQITECSIEDAPFYNFSPEDKKAVYDEVKELIMSINGLKPATVFDKPVNYKYRHRFELKQEKYYVHRSVFAAILLNKPLLSNSCYLYILYEILNQANSSLSRA